MHFDRLLHCTVDITPVNLSQLNELKVNTWDENSGEIFNLRRKVGFCSSVNLC